jgi:hypothetical protein
MAHGQVQEQEQGQGLRPLTTEGFCVARAQQLRHVQRVGALALLLSRPRAVQTSDAWVA